MPMSYIMIGLKKLCKNKQLEITSLLAGACNDNNNFVYNGNRIDILY